MKKIVLITLAALSLISCRSLVLEDRTACPSFVFFNIVNGDIFNGYDRVFTTIYSDPKGVLIDEGTPSVDEIQDLKFHFEVRSTPSVKGYGLIGNGNLNHDGSKWMSPLGQDYAPLFRFQYCEPVQEESFIIPVEFVKDYCHVTVQFVGYESFHTPNGEFPFYIIVRGNTNGIDALNGEPLRGPYEYSPEEMKETGHFEFNIPRLADEFLSLELYGKEGVFDETGHLRTFDLNEEIRNSGGIDWKQKNLPDIEIVINFVRWEVSMSIDPWEESVLNYES